MDKLYVVVRADLHPPQQAVQAIHAMRQWSHEFPAEDKAWFEETNTLALLAVANESDLGVLVERASQRGIPVACFHEPDRSNELTAIVLGPQGKRLASHLGLASLLKEP